ncbi:MAG: hypothetical protein JO128_01520 [Alphaproteobacteria bacterium]|nr:hypothetical protein [Alphaproteobacteria bacterium]
MGSVPIVTSREYVPPRNAIDMDRSLSGGARLFVRRSYSFYEDATRPQPFKRYEIVTENGDLVGEGFEAARQPLDLMAGSALPSRSPSHIEIFSGEARVLIIERPTSWGRLSATVSDRSGTIGCFRQRFRFLRQQLDVTAGDRLLATIANRFLQPSIFVMRDPAGGAQLATIEKQRQGILNAVFGMPVFALQLSSNTEPVFNRLALAAAILIDFLYLEEVRTPAAQPTVGPGFAADPSPPPDVSAPGDAGGGFSST